MQRIESGPLANGGSEDSTRQALIAAARRLFADEGINVTSIRRITAEAGAANQSAVHYHFENKLGLLRAVLDDINRQLEPLQEEACTELEALMRERIPTVTEIVSIGFAPYVYLFQQSHEGRLALRVLSRLTWESGSEAQDLLLQKVRPYFLRLAPMFQAALPDKPADVLDFQLYMAAANLIHGLSEITLLGREPDTPVATLYRDRPLELLVHFYSYISAGLAAPMVQPFAP